jgi:hypothetical protein
MNDEKVKEGVQAVVQEIYEENGQCSPSQLLERAKDKSSPAHSGFTWDNKKAGHEFRLIESRKWLRVVVIRTEAEQPERLVHVPVMSASEEETDSREGFYKPASVIVESCT